MLRQTAVLVAAGLVIGVPAVWALGRLVESQLHGVRPMDARTIAGAGLLVGLVALLASVAPAWRAGTVPPAEALRAE